MRVTVLIPLVLFLSACSTLKIDDNAITVHQDLLTPITFVEHADKAPMKSYLAMNVAYPPAADLLKQVEARLGFELKNRGEAHITVVSPVEYDNALAAKIPIEKINEIARQMKIQAAEFESVCVGRGLVNLDGRGEQTYYVVVKAPRLREIREAVSRAYLQAGGDPRAFDPAQFYPHITLGYTKRDLHYEDGIVKDDRSCWASLKKESAP